MPNLGSFAIIANGTGLSLSLKEGVSEPLYAATANTYFVLSQDLVIRVNDDGKTVTGRIISGPFDLPITKIK